MASGLSVMFIKAVSPMGLRLYEQISGSWRAGVLGFIIRS
ncbi:hypothetical protein V6Z11_A08G118900 [Gossypium hirsutum]